MSNNNKVGESGKIGFWSSTSLVVGNMTGSGIFLLPAALAIYGGISIFGWIFTLVGTIFLALVFSRLSRLITKAGGPYTYYGITRPIKSSHWGIIKPAMSA